MRPTKLRACKIGWLTTLHTSARYSSIFVLASSGEVTSHILIESIQIERQIVGFAFVIRHWAIGVTVKRHDAIYKIPHFFLGGMKDVSVIFMDIEPSMFSQYTLQCGRLSITKQLLPACLAKYA